MKKKIFIYLSFLVAFFVVFTIVYFQSGQVTTMKIKLSILQEAACNDVDYLNEIINKQKMPEKFIAAPEKWGIVKASILENCSRF